MNSSLVHLAMMNGMSPKPYGSAEPNFMLDDHENTKPCGLTGKQWSNRKSRSKIIKQSRKMNRK